MRRSAKRVIRKLLLTTQLSPGDIVMLTAAVRDLHTCYPRMFITDVRTPCPELWRHNPYLTPLSEEDPSVETIECHYPLIDRCDSTPYHCLHGYIEFLNERLGINVGPTAFKGDIHLSNDERSWYSQVHELTGEDTPFWVVVAGGKLDYTIKWWEVSRFQAVVDHFRGRIQFVQVGEAGHFHPRLQGVIDLRGRTDLRQLVRLIYHAQGVLCPVTSVMHLAAAIETRPGAPPRRPCVVIGGGREPWHWEAYPQHQYLHTNGALACCATGGCWRSRSVPLGDGSTHDHPENLCVDRINGLPRCMDMISADEVIEKIERYFLGGALHYLSPKQMRRAAQGIKKTSDNPFDDRLNVATARNAIESFISRITTPPRTFRGRGIIISGGLQDFPSVWVCLKMLRRMGCHLQTQIWHLSALEVTSEMRLLTADLNTQWVDAERMRKDYPARKLSGAELKYYALAHCSFKEVLMIDADNLPVQNPELLFETAEFRSLGAILWPGQGLLSQNDARWRFLGSPPSTQPELELDSGQFVLDKERCWAPVALCWWFNDHSDFFHEFAPRGHGTLQMAFRQLGLQHASPPPPLSMASGLCHHDFSGQRLFQHRFRDKWNLFRNNSPDPSFLHESECVGYLRELRGRMDGKAHCRSLLATNGSGKNSGPVPVTLVTAYDQSFYELAKITAVRMRHYARRHGFQFVEHRVALDRTRHPAWSKILAVRIALGSRKARWVMWLDADAVIMNFDFSPAGLIVENRDVIFGSDFNGLNSAVFLVRNCAWSREFMDTVYHLGDISYELDDYGPKWEQNTIKHVLQNFKGMNNHVAVLPERRMTASPGVYREGDFILHLGGMSHAERLKKLKELDLFAG